jgi:hypothetical protein
MDVKERSFNREERRFTPLAWPVAMLFIGLRAAYYIKLVGKA